MWNIKKQIKSDKDKGPDKAKPRWTVEWKLLDGEERANQERGSVDFGGGLWASWW